MLASTSLTRPLLATSTVREEAVVVDAAVDAALAVVAARAVVVVVNASAVVAAVAAAGALSTPPTSLTPQPSQPSAGLRRLLFDIPFMRQITVVM